MKSQIARLELLEARRRADPLIILTVDGFGNEKKSTVSEMLQNDLGFVCVVGGSSLSDLDRLLMAYHERAIRVTEGGEME